MIAVFVAGRGRRWPVCRAVGWGGPQVRLGAVLNLPACECSTTGAVFVARRHTARAKSLR